MASSAPRGTRAHLEDLQQRLQESRNAGSARSVETQHAKGKLTARERIELLLDPGSFVELGELSRHRCTDFGMAERRPYGDGVVTGHGTVDGRPVCLFAHDFTVLGGSVGEIFAQRVAAVMGLALKIGCPIIGINDSAGARIQEGVVSLAAYAEIGAWNVMASGVVPQISLIMGPCAGGAVYCPAGTDFTAMVEGTSHMFITGPEVVRATSGTEVSAEELGGGFINNAVAGNAHYLATDEHDAIDWVRVLLGFLPSSYLGGVPSYAHRAAPGVTATDRELDSLVPDSAHDGYDMHEVIRRVVDDGDFLEVASLFARNLICGFARVEGRTVGVVANQPLMLAGAIDIDASEKGASFVRFCDAFDIPLVTFVDVPGYLPGVEQETRGIIRRGAKLPFAYAEATVPKVTVVTRKAYGGGYAVMGSKHFGADINLAWPTAEIAVMGAEAAVFVLHRKELMAAGADAETLYGKLVEEYRTTLLTPYVAAERGYIDAVIPPSHTRSRVASALRILRDKREERPSRKHNTMPL